MFNSNSLRSILLCLSFTLLFPAALFSQGGSNYSTIGLGDLRSSFGSTYDGLANVSYSTPSNYAINLCNPALWTDVKTTRLQSGYRFNQLFVSQNGSTVGNNNGKLDGALIMFALDTTNGVNASLGLLPSSSVNYLFTKTARIPLPDNGGFIDSRSLYAGSGGMITGYVGGAYRVSDKISLGAMFLFNFGVIRDSINTTLSSEESYMSLTSRSDKLSSMGVKLGIQTIPAESWTLGATLGLNSDMKINSDLHYSTLNGIVISYDSTISTESSSSMPLLFGVGASYRSGKFLFVADAEMQNASSMTYRLTDLGRWANASRFGVGLSRVGTQSAGTAYWDRVNFNFGLGYQTLAYSFKNNSISESFASVGAQLPFGNAAMIDAALTFGTRGSSDSAAISELFVRMNFTISVGEVWFIPFKRE